TITEGDDAVFTITVINTGETDLTSVTVVDALSPACDTTIATLAVGEFQTYSCTLASVGSSFTNSIDVIATDPIGGTWTASDTADVIVLPTGVMDGFVFEDVDGDGAYTAAVDQPIASVDVLLSLADGSLLVVATQADGTWTAVVPVGDTSANVDETDPDFPGGLVESTGTDGQTVTVVDTSTTSTAPVGYAPTAQLSGTVFEDTDGDGLQTGEPGVGGVVVRLWEDVDGNGTPDVLVSTTATGGGGDYLFADLAQGDYLVEVLPPGGMDLTFQDQGADDGLDSDVSPATGLSDIRSLDFGGAGDIDAGVYTPVVLGDMVFFDVDGDGLQGAGEPGVGGVMVTATSAGPDGSFGTADDRSVSTSTDSSGLYSLQVPPGLVGVEVAEPAGTVVTTGNDGSVLAVVSGDIVDTVDFGVDADATLSGSVVLDANSDGTLDPADAGLSGVALTATWAGPDGVFGTADDFEFATTTASDGTYLFVGLPPGDYSVTIDRAGLPAGTVDSFDRDGTADGTTSVTLAANELVPDADFGVIGTGDLSVVMFHDIDGDGVLDAGEPALVAVSVTGSWAGPDGVVGTSDDVEYSTVTDGSGLASLSNLPAGSFVVAVDETTLPAGMVQTADPDSILDSMTSATLGAGESVDAGRFGYRGSGAIGDTVFFDLDHDGIQDFGEPGVAGVDVIVIWAGADGVFGTADDVTYRATTDSAGQYLVSGLPTGSYRASVDPATTPDGSGAPGQSFLLGAGQTYLDADFGIGGNNPPEAVDDSAETLEDTAVTVIVLANDTDPEGHALVVTIVTDPGNGSVVVNPDGSITYTPDPDFWGADTFTYTVCEAPGTIGPIPPEGLCDVAGVVVTVTPVNDAPVLVSPTVITGVVGSTLPPLAFQDAENDPFSVVLASGALPAGVSLLPDGTFSGVPTQAGTYVFSITVCDNAVPAACSTVFLTMVIATGAVSGGSQIPYTGINTQSQLLLAVLLVLAGAAFVVLARRRRSRPSETGTHDRVPAPSGSKRVGAVPPSPGPTGPRRVGHGPAVVPFESDEG
ncbi:MAG: Ig-like domain-containing protein, partial [Acidimicrobiia bacterium]|nr:Ig-like domain-containing protein [Acidimicrobiia bacterium]